MPAPETVMVPEEFALSATEPRLVAETMLPPAMLSVPEPSRPT